MAVDCFGPLTRAMTAAGTRRGLLRFGTALPLAGVIGALLGEGSDAGRRHRRKAQHRHQRGDGKDNRKGKRKGGGTGNGNGNGSGSLCLPPTENLQKAIDEASEGSTLHLCEGTWMLTDTILISKGIQIYGPPGGGSSVLNGQGAVQVVGIRPEITVTFDKVTFIQGDADEGAGIFNQGNLGLYDCQVTHSRARLGGGIYNQGTLSLYDSTVSDNAVTKSSDPLDPEYDGGGIYNDEGTVNVHSGTIISDNTANDEGQDFGMGGGIFNYYGDVTLHSGGQVTDNHAATHGGGLYNRAGQVTLQAGSSVSGNVAGDSGGGLYNEPLLGSTVSIAASTIVTGNNPDNCSGGPVPNCVG